MIAPLSVCTVTAAAPAHAAAFLAPWRELAGELVVAVDERADPATVEVAAAIADVVAVVPAMPFMERVLGWLHGRCTREWVLRVDDDELPSAALEAALPGLVAERALSHFSLPRSWPHPTPDEAITDAVWGRDVQLRLVRNVPGLWRFPGRLHTNIEVAGAGRIADAPLLHLVNLLWDVERRRARRDAYEAHGVEAPDGAERPLNAVYTPEDEGVLNREPVPAADARRIREFLAAARGAGPAAVFAGRPGPPGGIERPTTTECEVWCDERTLSPGAGHAAVRLVRPLAPLRAGTLRHVIAEVGNRGDDWWPQGPMPCPAVAVGTRWFRPDGTEVAEVSSRAPFTERVRPGATTRVAVGVRAPAEPGTYTVRVGVVHEHVAWFEGEATQAVEVTGGGA